MIRPTRTELESVTVALYRAVQSNQPVAYALASTLIEQGWERSKDNGTVQPINEEHSDD